jgi:hypothetical protein
VGLDCFHNRACNFFDHDALGDSNIVFPLTIESARARGFEAALKKRRLWGRTQVSLA